MTGFRHIAWTAQGTTPAEIAEALRRLLIEGQMRHAGHGARWTAGVVDRIAWVWPGR